MAIVNSVGLSEISGILADRLNDVSLSQCKDVVISYAQDCEYQLSIGNPPCFEICKYASLSGHTEEFEISASGISLDC